MAQACPTHPHVHPGGPPTEYFSFWIQSSLLDPDFIVSESEMLWQINWKGAGSSYFHNNNLVFISLSIFQDKGRWQHILQDVGEMPLHDSSWKTFSKWRREWALCCSRLIQYVAKVAHGQVECGWSGTLCMASDSVRHLLWGFLCCHTAKDWERPPEAICVFPFPLTHFSRKRSDECQERPFCLKDNTKWKTFKMVYSILD